MMPSILSVQRAFFAAMAAGYSDPLAKSEVLGSSGVEVGPFEWGDFVVRDRWSHTPHSDASMGTTMIWHRHNSVWAMHYGGEYAEVALPFLKECLYLAYFDGKEFFGGRGPRFVRGDRFTYVNTIIKNDFRDFYGEERIFDLDGQPLGYHWYRGMALALLADEL